MSRTPRLHLSQIGYCCISMLYFIYSFYATAGKDYTVDNNSHIYYDNSAKVVRHAGGNP
jgi:hypothetical protein